MLCYSFDHKDEIYEYVILNNLFDDIRFERFLSVMGKIEEGLNNIQEIRWYYDWWKSTSNVKEL